MSRASVEMADELSSRSVFLIVLESSSFIVLNILALLGNILVCIAVYRNTKLRTNTNLYIIALAVSDLLSAVLVMPFSTGVLISGRWPFGETFCKVNGFITVFAIYVSPATMGLTALNRYVRICKSDRLYQRFFSQRKSIILLASAWVFVFFYLILMVPLTGLQEFRFAPSYAQCLNVHTNEVAMTVHYFVVVGLFLVLPLALTIFSYRKVFEKIREHNKGLAQASYGQTRFRRIGSQEIQISRSLFVVVFAFMVCWVTIWVVNLLARFRAVPHMPRNVQLLCAFFLSLSNTINPFIYAGMNPLFRREFQKVLCCKCVRLGQETPRTSKDSTGSPKAQTEETDENDQEAVTQEGRVPSKNGDIESGQGIELAKIN